MTQPPKGTVGRGREESRGTENSAKYPTLTEIIAHTQEGERKGEDLRRGKERRGERRPGARRVDRASGISGLSARLRKRRGDVACLLALLYIIPTSVPNHYAPFTMRGAFKNVRMAASAQEKLHSGHLNPTRTYMLQDTGHERARAGTVPTTVALL